MGRRIVYGAPRNIIPSDREQLSRLLITKAGIEAELEKKKENPHLRRLLKAIEEMITELKEKIDAE